MKIQLLPSSVAGPPDGQNQYLTSFIINDSLAIDAGSIGLLHSPDVQCRIKHVLISHTHLDHIASLPLFVDTVYDGSADCVTIHGSRFVLDCLRKDIFNDRVWADFVSMSTAENPILKLAPLEAGNAVELAGLRVLPIAVDHVVPTLGFLIEDKNSAVVIVSDTGPTEGIWRYANQSAKLKAVFMEASFPNDMASLAAAAKHLTPALFGREARKLKRLARLIAVHIKPRFRDKILKGLSDLGLPNLEIGKSDEAYVL